MDIDGTTTTDESGGIPDRMVFGLETEGACAASIMVEGSDTNNFTTSHDLLAAGLTTAGISQSAEPNPPPNRYIRGVITGGVACDIEVVMKLFFLKKDN
jgi:hypothetical protein